MKTTFKYDHYYKYEELKSNLEYFVEHYPELCSLESICVTAEGRNVYAMTITNTKTGAPETKPAFHIDGNHHAGEVTGCMAAMHAIDYLITNYGEDTTVTKLLDGTTIYVIPRVSPDGAETYLSTPYTLRSVNRVHKPEVGGMTSEDLDGDGVIRMMRIPTPYGAWKIDPNKDGAMAVRLPDDTDGTYYDIYSEGSLEPFEGDENLKSKKADWALDFNRNYPFGWYPEGRQAGAGVYPLSNPENKAMADWILSHKNIGGVSTNHTSGGLILYPPGTKPEKDAPKSDMDNFIAIANMGKEETGYVVLNIFDNFIQSQAAYDSGAFDDWCYQSEGIPAYTIELWDLANRVGHPTPWGEGRRTENRHDAVARLNACMDWVKENCPQHYCDWTPYKHPVFGDVEIGGFNIKFTHQNPPEHMLLEQCENLTKFMVRFAKAMPRLTVDCVTVEDLGADLHKVTAIVGNLGFLPTNLTEVAKTMGRAKPVTVKIEGAEVVSGLECQEIGNLEGFSSTATGVFVYGNISTRSAAKAKKKLTWVVKAPTGATVKVTACQEKSGVACAEATL